MEDESLSALQTELLLAIQGLGTTIEGDFNAHPKALDRLKEIDTLLRKDTPERQYVHFYLGQKQALQSHIIPLAIARNNEAPVIFLCLKIFTRLTLPLPTNVENYLQRLTQLHDAKQAIIQGDVIAVLMTWMGELFTDEPSERKRADNDSLELFCSLFKNLLAIPNPSRALASSLSDWDLNLQDRCILKLGEEHVLNALVTLAEGCSERKVAEGCEGVRESVTLMLMQCFFYLFKNETEEDLQGGSMSSSNVDLVKASKGVSSEKDSLVQRLLIHQKKQIEEVFLRTRGQSSRHSRFGTMIVQSSQLGARAQLVKNVFSANDLAADLYIDDGSNRKPCPDAPPRAYFNDQVRQTLFQTAELLLNRGAYNELMSTMLTWLQSDSTTALPEDATCFIHVCYVLMGVHRLIVKRQVRKAEKKKLALGFTIKNIRATLSKEAFSFLVSRIQMSFTVKPTDYVTLATCMGTYKEIVRCVYEMTFHGDEETKLEAGEMRGVLFDDTEHVGILPRCFKAYTAQRNNQRHLTNLVHAAHFSIRILTHMAKIGHKVQSKRRKKQKKTINSELMLDLEDGYVPAPRVTDEPEEAIILTQEKRIKKPKKMKKKRREKIALASGRINKPQPEPKPVASEDGSLETEQTESANNEEGSRMTEETNGAQQVEENKHASSETLQEEQEGQPAEEAEKGEAEAVREEAEANEGDEQGNEGDEKEQPETKETSQWEYDEDEGFDEEYSRREHVFNFEQYVSTYVHHQIIRSYCQLLAHYKVNSLETNGCILKFFELISSDPFKMSALFFQLSVLVLFDQIVNDETIHHDKNFASLRQFCKNVVRRFLDVAADNAILFVEALWLKTPQFAEQLLEPFKVLTSQELQAMREDQESRREMQRQMEDEADMEEAGFNENTTWVPKPQSGASGTQKVRWTKSDDALLAKEYPSFKDLPECLEMLGSLFQPPREEATIRRRLKTLGLTGRRQDSDRDDAGDYEDRAPEEPELAPLPSAADLREALTVESKEAIAVLVELLEKCGSYREEPFVDLALIPTTALEWEVLGSAGVKALTMVGCLPPESGQVFWRLPATARLDEILTLLKDDSLFSDPDSTNLKRPRGVTGRSRLKKMMRDDPEQEQELFEPSLEESTVEVREHLDEAIDEAHEPQEPEETDVVRIVAKRKKKLVEEDEEEG